MPTTLFRIAPLLTAAALLAQTAPPPTPKKPVTDTYHKVTVTDDYRWLEDFDDPAVKQWAAAQNAYSRTALDALPDRDALSGELRKIFQPAKARYFPLVQRGAAIFAMKSDQRHQHQIVVTLTSLDDLSSERTVLDPDALDPKHLTEIDFAVPSPDGRYLAASLSTSGSESGDLHVFETATGNPLPDVIPRVNYATAGGAVVWNTDTTGFYYTRYPRDGERPPADMHFYQQIYFHKLGDKPENDKYEIGKDFPKIAEIEFTASHDNRYIGAGVAFGDGGDHEYWLLAPGKAWRRLASVADEVKQIAFGYHKDIYVLSRHGARRGKVLHIDVAETLDQANVLVPESSAVIQSIAPTPDGPLVNELAGGPSEVIFLPGDGTPAKVHVPPVSNVDCGNLDGSGPICYEGSYLDPGGFFRFDPHTRKLTPTALRIVPAVPLDGFVVTRVFAVSKDGAKIPLNIIHKKGLPLDGSHPTLLTGYGGYNVSLTPNYPAPYIPLLERGVVFAEANLRGGGEFGEDWHTQGNLTKKQNVFDDFAACATYLVHHKYTESSRLAIIGGSNGGLLMGAAFTQHPELYHAVVSMVGIYDMLRVELSPNGAFNVTEFGTVKEADQFKALYAYSPYHHVKDGTQYPAILLTTGDNDARVDPMNSRKMAARLQAGGTQQPVLLRTSSTAGHGIGSSIDENVALWTDIDAFLLHQLAVH
ncbi:MAG TPA: prolyl oligopeptidase family serine peptidase [Bryobacteraceae bacterium]|nr:prolyl oligopeptidase family serine peptidase [Bryobacteraceae bacterium]